MVFILDSNGIQIDGYVREIMPLPDMAKIYEEVGWNTIEIDGNNMEEIEKAFNLISNKFAGSEKPTLIVANTIPGKGVDFMENKYEWHDWRSPDEEMIKSALDQIHNKIKSFL